MKLLCRLMGHRWGYHSVLVGINAGHQYAWYQCKHCDRCHVEVRL